VITVLLVDDHPVFLETLRFLISQANDIQVVASALDGVDAVIQAQLFCPDVVVMDVSMPVMDGIEATKQIRVHCLSSRVIMLSIYDSPEYVQRALKAGASGYVLKDVVGTDLLTAIRALYAGNQYFSQRIAAVAEQYKRRDGDESLPS
jgi:DNA-binding NarL/FixJ family response regulator